MSRPDPDIVALVGSRICHDLINPLGAIGNGVELISLTGGAGTPEMALIAESVENATARIRFFRIAFGDAHPGHEVSEDEIAGLCAAGGAGHRITVDWQALGPQPRIMAKLMFLLMLCFESTMPWGGRLTITRSSQRWQLTGQADRLRDLPEHWALVTEPGRSIALDASHVHFALVAPVAEALGRRPEVQIGADTATVTL